MSKYKEDLVDKVGSGRLRMVLHRSGVFDRRQIDFIINAVADKLEP